MFTFTRTRRLEPPVLPHEEEQFIPKDSREKARPGSSGCSSLRLIWLVTMLNIAFLIISVASAVSSHQYKAALKHNRDNAVIRMVDWYSPLHDQIQMDFVDQTINGSLLDMDKSIFRAPPSPEADAAWERIGSLWPHVIGTDDVIRLGKDPSKTARWPLDWGFGPEAHVAELDVLHTIHCLNAIRRDVHWRYYYIEDYPDGVFPELHRIHTDHCMYIVLQNLMCSATADIVTNPWVEGQLHPFPDFSVNKKCRNFDAILEWHERTMVKNMTKYAEMRMPQGHEPYHMTQEFHEVFGTGLDNHGGHAHDHGKAGVQ